MPLPAQNAVINPAADRRLKRIALACGAALFVMFLLSTLLLSWADAKYGGGAAGAGARRAVSPQLVLLELLGVLMVLVPFYAGIHRLYTARLEIGRERAAARAWGETVAALEPFAAPMHRLLDVRGEAHFLLAQAYAGLGDKARAEKARAVVRRKKGVWAEKLAPSAGRGAGVYRAGPDGADEKKPRPPKSGPRKRF